MSDHNPKNNFNARFSILVHCASLGDSLYRRLVKTQIRWSSQGCRNWWCWWWYSITNHCQFSIGLPLIAPPIFLASQVQDYSSTTNFSYLPAPLHWISKRLRQNSLDFISTSTTKCRLQIQCKGRGNRDATLNFQILIFFTGFQNKLYFWKIGQN